MLQSIRDKSKGWFAWIVVGAICVTFALWGVHSYLYNSNAKDIVAKVNGVEISRQDFLNFYNKLKRQQQINLAANSLSKQASEQLKKAALQSLVSSVVLNQAAGSDGFIISPALVAVTLAKMPIFQVNGVFSPQKFQEIIGGMLYTPETFTAQLRSNILNDQIKSGFVETSFALPNEVNQAVRLINQQRKFAYFIVPINRFLSEIKLPIDAAENYYKQNQNEFKMPEQVSIEYLQLSINKLMQKIRPTTQELKQFYQNNLSSYTTPKQFKLAVILIAIPKDASKKQLDDVKKKIENVEMKLKQGGNFSDLAKRYSDDVQTANKGGVMPWVTTAQLDSQLRQVVTQLSMDKSISSPIQTARGYEIIKLLNIKPQTILSFDKVKNKVLLAYQQQKAEAQFSNLNDQLANITYENPSSLQKASQVLGLPIQATSLFSRESAEEKGGILKNPQIISAAFNDDVLNGGNNSDPINLGDNSVVVLRVKQHKKASVKSFNIVKKEIENKLRQQMAAKKAENFSNQLLKLVNAGRTIESVAKQKGLSYHIANYVLMHAKEIDLNILDAAFKLSPSFKNTKAGNVVVNISSKDFAVISLLDVKDGDIKYLSSSKKQMFKKAASNNFGISDYQSYINSLMKKAKIKYSANSKA